MYISRPDENFTEKAISITFQPFKLNFDIQENIQILTPEKTISYMAPTTFYWDATRYIFSDLRFKAFNLVADKIFLNCFINFTPTIFYRTRQCVGHNLIFVDISFSPYFSASELLKMGIVAESASCSHIFLHSIKLAANNFITQKLDLAMLPEQNRLCITFFAKNAKVGNLINGRFLLFQIQIFFDPLTTRKYRVSNNNNNIFEAL